MSTRSLEAAGARVSGISLALVTAVISGLAVFLNSYGVAAFGDPTAYTTAKNLVAAVVIGAAALSPTWRRSSRSRIATSARSRLGLLAVAIIGGSVPFVLFFEGLSRASSTQAAFIHKTLVVWVVLLAVPLLKERLGPLHLAAVVLVVGGQAALQGTFRGFTLGGGEWMILAATLLWSVEVVLAKRLLRDVSPMTVGVARMGGGVLLLIAYTVFSGRLGSFTDATAEAWMWVFITGLILAAYVGTWFFALSAAPAMDVTAVLVLAAVITALLQYSVQGAVAPNLTLGAALIAAGTAITVIAGRRTRAEV